MITVRTAPAVLVLLAAAACGGATSPAASSSPSTAAPAAPGAPDASGGRAPGVSGLLAAVNGRTLQVQTATSQTAVVYGPTTRITAVGTARASAVTVGSCVVVRGPATGAASTAPSTSVTATTVTISAPAGGSCVAGAGFGPGRQRGFGGSGAPRPRPSGGFAGRRGFGAFGTVSAVYGSSFVVTSPAGPGGTAPTVTVATTPTTRYLAQRRAGPAALVVGVCVTARGRADSTGTITATALAVRPAVNGACGTGGSGLGGGGPGGAGLGGAGLGGAGDLGGAGA